MTNLNPYYYYNNPNTGIPWVSKALAYAFIPVALRYGKVFGVINGSSVDEYWWKDEANLADGDEVAKVGSGGGGGTALTTPTVTFGTLIPGQVTVQSTTPTGTSVFNYYRKTNSTPPVFGTDTPIHTGSSSSLIDDTVGLSTEYWYSVITQGYEYLHSAPGTNNITTLGIIPLTADLLFANRDFITKTGYKYQNAFSYTKDITTSTSLEIDYYTNVNGYSFTGSLAIYVDDVLKEIISQSTNGAHTATVDLGAEGTKTVRVVNGPQNRPTDIGEILGTYIVEKRYSDAVTPVSAFDNTNVIFFYGNSISVGASCDVPITEGLIPLMRTKSSFSDYTIVAMGYASKGIHPTWGDGTLLEADAQALATRCSGIAGKIEIVFALGTNDYGIGYSSPTQAKADLLAFITRVKQLVSGAVFRIITPYLRFNENNPGGSGFRLPPYRTTLAKIRLGKEAYVNIIDGSHIDFINTGHSADGLHPGTLGVSLDLEPALTPQLVSTIGITEAPILQSSIISDDAQNQVKLTYDISVSSTAGLAYTDFTIPSHTTSAITIVGTVITLTITDNFGFGESVLPSGGNNKIQGSTGLISTNLLGEVTQNNILNTDLHVNDFAGTNVSVTGNNVVATADLGNAASSLFIPFGKAGYIDFTIHEISPSGTGLIGLSSSPTPSTSYTSVDFGLQADGNYNVIDMGGIGGGPTAVLNDRARVYTDGSGLVQYKISSDGGVTFSTIATASHSITTDMYFKFWAFKSGRQALDITYWIQP